MNATQTLPAHYRLFKRLSIRDAAPLLLLNLASLLLLGLAGALVLALLRWLRPQDAAAALSFSIQGVGGFLPMILTLLGATFGMMVVHEAFHGIFFWHYTGTRPKFGFRGAYACAAAPDWYLTRDQYLVTGLAPLVGITVIGILLLAFAPAGWIPLLVLVVVFNASGAVGDLWVTSWLLRCPPDALCNDQGDETCLYVPDEPHSESL